MKFSIYQNSRQGSRPFNQDRVAYSFSKDALLVVLADGMGGRRYGDIAAQLAVKMLVDAFQRNAQPKLADPIRFLEEEIRHIHATIEQNALNAKVMETPHTTIVAAVVQDNLLYCAHVGDSRLYYFRNGTLLFRTEDHSQVQKMLRNGTISSAELLTHPERHKIYNCLGSATPPLVELTQKGPLQDGDTVLLCSDGLWSQVEDGEIGKVLQRGSAPSAVPMLLQLAESHAEGEGDNMTAVAFNWWNPSARHFSVSTATMPLDQTTTILVNPLGRPKTRKPEEVPPNPPVSTGKDALDQEIEDAISEIQSAIKRTGK